MPISILLILVFQLTVMDLTPEESRSKLQNSFRVLKNIPFRHHKTQLELA